MNTIFKDDNYIVVKNTTTGKFSYGLRKFMRDDKDFAPNHTEQTAQEVISQIKYRNNHSKMFWLNEFGYEQNTAPKWVSTIWESEDKILALLTALSA